MSVNYEGFAFPKPSSRYESKKSRKAEEAKQLREAYRAVDARDGRVCRICKKHADPNALAMLDRAERHHVLPRSLGGKDTTDNLVVVCRGCHEEIHRHGRARLQGDANAVRGVALMRLTAAGWVVERWI